ncbi:MAG: hypothetical protein MUQ10_15415 [Anaerolineae bacterium]|nr:hypothetical protein [Anaerolineae bacterium]
MPRARNTARFASIVAQHAPAPVVPANSQGVAAGDDGLTRIAALSAKAMGYY